MKVLYQIPSLNTIYAGRTIYYGYKNAFEDLGYTFRPLTADDNPEKIIENFNPDILFTCLTPYYLKYLPPDTIKKFRQRGVRIFVNLPLWKSPMSKLRINETKSISENQEFIRLIRSGAYGDIYYNVYEQGDQRMDGFEKVTGYKHITILLAADKKVNFPEYSKRFKADISYVGTYLPEKKRLINRYIYPLRERYDLKLYGQDWTYWDRSIGVAQKIGHYFNIPLLRSIQKAKLQLEDERRIYSSSVISINVHDEYQRRFGGDCNERTFKIPLCGGFEITDDVTCIRKYFKEGKEIVIAKNLDDWFDKIHYYIKNPEKRLPIIEAGRKHVQKEHTYHNRVEQILKIYNTIN